MPQRVQIILLLFVAIFAISTGAIFARLAQDEGAPSLVVAAGRLTTATILLTPLALGRYRDEIRNLNPSRLGLAILSGIVLSLHFATWISSLEYTSVTVSVVLVTTSPLFVAVLSYPLLGEKVSQGVVIGIVLAFIGGVIVAVGGEGGDPPTRSDPLLGNTLALIGAATVALYLIIGRRLRGALSLIPYVWLVYGVGAICLLFFAVASGESLTGYSALAYFWFLCAGIVPQILGHSSFNYALGFLPVAYVSLMVLVEPVGSTILAILVLGEYPAAMAVLGSAIILVGVVFATRDQSEEPVEAAKPQPSP